MTSKTFPFCKYVPVQVRKNSSDSFCLCHSRRTYILCMTWLSVKFLMPFLSFEFVALIPELKVSGLDDQNFDPIWPNNWIKYQHRRTEPPTSEELPLCIAVKELVLSSVIYLKCAPVCYITHHPSEWSYIDHSQRARSLLLLIPMTKNILVKLVTTNSLNESIQFLPESSIDAVWYMSCDIFFETRTSSSICFGTVRSPVEWTGSSKSFTEPTVAASCTAFRYSEWITSASNPSLCVHSLMCVFIFKIDRLLNKQVLSWQECSFRSRSFIKMVPQLPLLLNWRLRLFCDNEHYPWTVTDTGMYCLIPVKA